MFFNTTLNSPEMSIIPKRLTSQLQNVFNRQLYLSVFPHFEGPENVRLSLYLITVDYRENRSSYNQIYEWYWKSKYNISYHVS